MCGIYGELTFGPRISAARVKEAATIIRHRGVDDEGYLVASTRDRTATVARGDESVGITGAHLSSLDLENADVVLAFRRLAIVDLSPAGAQPMVSNDGLCWIVYNGEIYNHVELREELSNLGHRFRGHSDSEVLLAAYREWGVSCVERLNGMWAFCILDLRRPDMPLFLSRDRMGEKPLFFELTDDGFRFASEAKALISRSKGGFRPDIEAATRYLANGVMPSASGGKTFFLGLDQLPPATCMLLGRGGSTQWKYWSIPLPDGQPHRLEDAIDDVRRDLDESVRIRLRADVPVGTCLSGGVDSSAIATTMARVGGPEFDKQHTFTAAFDIPGPHDEREHVEKVLAVLNAVSTLSFPTAEGLSDELDSLVWHQDEPFGGSSIYAQWCVMRSAAELGVRVILDGQGADELFGGYRPFAYAVADQLRHGHFAAARADVQTLQRELGMDGRAVFSKALALSAGPDWIRPLRDVARRRLRPNPPVLAAGIQVPPALRAPDPGSHRDLLDRHLRNVTLEASLPELLRYEDRNAMAHGVESRTPFLDHRLVETAFGSAAAFRSSPPWTKYVLRRAVEDRLPAEIVWRKDKIGFETPESAWRPVIRELLRERLVNNPVADLVDGAACMTDAVDNRALWRAMNLASWWQVFQKAAQG